MIEAMKQWLKSLQWAMHIYQGVSPPHLVESVLSLEKAIAEAEKQEPVSAQCKFDTEKEWGYNPYWTKHYEYRIKPEPKPDIVVSRWVYRDGSTAHCSQSNVKYTFDGATGELKSAEVLK
jgi:hypothetical protein